MTEKYVDDTERDVVSEDTRPVGDNAAFKHPAAPARLVAGASIADGRYRLLVLHGGAAGLQFWQALDIPLNRQVAVTVVGGAGPGHGPGAPVDEDLVTTVVEHDVGAGIDADRVVADILTRTLRLSRFDVPGIARLLDVVRTAEGGLIVSEWIRGASLKEVAEVSPSPIGAARAIQALAAAADVAHRAGLPLSIDHPSRLRVSISGDVVLAFPATTPEATPLADVRGIGAALYALLVNRWPLPESGLPSGIAPAERGPDGLPEVPQAINLSIPFPISALAARAVASAPGVTGARTLSDGLQRAITEADRTSPLPTVRPTPQPPPRRWVGLRAVPGLFEQVRGRRRAGLLAGLGAAGAIMVVALVVLASVLGHVFGDVNGFDTNRLGLTAPSSSQPPTASPNRSAAQVKPVSATVFSPGGGADNPGQAGLAIAGDPNTGWPTDTYFDGAPFPGFKSGVGLLLQLPRPAVVTAVGLDVPSTGTQVQIRSSPTASPAALSDTTQLTPPVPLQPGHNRIPVDNASPTSTVLVWISTLGTTNGQSRTQLSNVTVDAAS